MRLRHQPGDFGARAVETFFEQEPAIEHGTAAIGDARTGCLVHRLAAVDAVDVDGGAARSLGDDGHGGDAAGQGRTELVAHQVEQVRHALDGADAQIRHAAVRNAAHGHHLEPVDAAMADAHAVDTKRLGNDHGLGPLARDPVVLGEPRHPGEATALLVHRATDLDRRRMRHTRTPDGFGREHRGRQARLHVAGATAVEAAIQNFSTERVASPTQAGRHDIEMAIQVDGRSLHPPLVAADDVNARMSGGVLRLADRGEQMDVRAMPAQLIADGVRARFILLARRVDGGDAHQPGGEVHNLVGSAVDFGENLIDVRVQHRCNFISYHGSICSNLMARPLR